MLRMQGWCMIASLLMVSSITSASLTWNFDDGTTQGWYQSSEGSVSLIMNSDDNYLLQIVGSGGPGSQSLKMRVDTSCIVNDPSDTLSFDYHMWNITSGLVGGLSAWVYSPDLSGGSANQALDYVTSTSHKDITLSDFGLEAGDAITGIEFYVFTVTSNALYLDNVNLVPEPATMLIWGMGGLISLFRRKH